MKSPNHPSIKFLEQNPTLAKYVQNDLGTLEDGNYVFRLQDLSDYEAIIDYIAAIIQLIASICLSRNMSVGNVIIDKY